MMLLDSTVWIDWLRDERSAPVTRLEALLDEGDAAICPVILEELLQAASNPARLQTLQQRFSRLPIVGRDDSVRLHAEAGSLYARARWAGVTVRSPNDCLIAATALRAAIPLLHDDRDFEKLEEVERSLRLMRG